MAWTGKYIIIWSGSGALNPTVPIGGALYDPVAKQWWRIPDTGAPAARYSAGLVWTGTELLVVGGVGNNKYNNVYFLAGARLVIP